MSKHKQLIRWTVVFGVVTLLIAGVMALIFPQQAELKSGFTTPVLAFQFAQSEADIAYLSGDSPVHQANRKAMKQGHYWDMVFPFAYAGFLVLLLLQVICQGNKLALFAVPIALVIIPLDIHENIALLAILDAIENSTVLSPAVFDASVTSAWLKWSAIGLTTGVLSVCYWQQRRYVLSLLAAFNMFSTLLAIVLHYQAQYVELMAFSIAPFMLIVFISQVVVLKRNK